MLRNLSLNLKGVDFLKAYVMLACLLVEKEFGVEKSLMEKIMGIVNGENVRKEEVEGLVEEVEVKIKAATTTVSNRES